MNNLILSLLLGSGSARISKGFCVPTGEQGSVQAFQNVELDRMEGTWFPMYFDLDFMKGYKPDCIKADVVLAPGSAYSM